MSAARSMNMELNTAAYRGLACPAGFTASRVLNGQTDLVLYSCADVKNAAEGYVAEARQSLIAYMKTHPGFRESLKPLPYDENAPEVVRAMLQAGIRGCLGPMAAVAGAIAEYVGRRLLADAPEIIAENGGDVFFRTSSPRRFGIIAETARYPLIAISVDEAVPGNGMGVCTSSGRLGPSLNFGNADAVTIIAEDTALSDALATATSNRIRMPQDIASAMDWAMAHGASGVVVIAFDRVAAQGTVRFSD